ncbi:manetosome protein Mad25 [Fundidesulfovibrio magnetotacticus]|uniref:Manetosome protein Mad25 n=1 Tax=Fundidesulfovibrio magnetotacticus TaxID=2730080 RepID=A0A6V8LHX0_9BACT|nr:hypothetical protein [Fundidesulfovibrio magnetotacticus]GFK92313.1 manetosome protein Mad25 [Fundidesulfovibrio magnetotacticus]
MPPIDTSIKEHLNALLDRGKGAGAAKAPAASPVSTALQRDGASVDFENVIAEMLGAIQDMETQLSSVLEINTLLETDLNQAKERIRELRQEREKLLSTIARLEEEMPSKRELQMVIDQLIEERSDAEITIRDLRRRDEQVGAVLKGLQDAQRALEDSRAQLQSELAAVEVRLEAALKDCGKLETRNRALEEKNAANAAAIKELEADLRMALDERFRLSIELDETRRALAAMQGR